MKRNVFSLVFVLLMLLLVCCCKNDGSDNKIVVKEYDPMVIFDIDNPYSIDINLDGINDLQAYVVVRSGFYIQFYFKSFSASFLVSSYLKKNGQIIRKLNELDIINENLSWSSDTPWDFYIPDSINGDYYLGVKMIQNDSVYYGWVLPKYIHPATDQYKQGIYIYKTAFCTVPNYEILAGQEELYLE